jgi:hypothetical protein
MTSSPPKPKPSSSVWICNGNTENSSTDGFVVIFVKVKKGNMESIADLWFEAFQKHQKHAHEARRCGQETDGFCRAMLISHAEYRIWTAIEMMEAKKK